VPVVAHATPPSAVATIVAARNLAPGSVLRDGDLQFDATDAALSEQVAAMVGMETRRLLIEGALVRETDLRTATLVRRNGFVRMLYAEGPLNIEAEGRALSGGGKGDLIKVMNLTSKIVVSAEVADEGLVAVK
jgi:flagella basal body P-ring formation protein FlgA